MGLRDYVAWHDAYGRPGSRLHLRLLAVRDLLGCALDELPPGPIRVISVCAGQGDDLITVARRHRRGGDLVGRLIEQNPHNARVARERIADAGLGGLEVLEGDAGRSDAYAGACPADLILVCGTLGNMTDEEAERTVAFLPRLCSQGAWLVWTRHPEPEGAVERVERRLAEAGFELRALVLPEDVLFSAGASQLVGPPLPFEPGVRLFEFHR